MTSMGVFDFTGKHRFTEKSDGKTTACQIWSARHPAEVRSVLRSCESDTTVWFGEYPSARQYGAVPVRWSDSSEESLPAYWNVPDHKHEESSVPDDTENVPEMSALQSEREAFIKTTI